MVSSLTGASPDGRQATVLAGLARVRLNVRAGEPAGQVGDAVKLLHDNGYGDVIVDTLDTVAGTDALAVDA